MFWTDSSPKTISCSGVNMLFDFALATMGGGEQSCARAGAAAQQSRAAQSERAARGFLYMRSLQMQGLTRRAFVREEPGGSRPHARHILTPPAPTTLNQLALEYQPAQPLSRRGRVNSLSYPAPGRARRGWSLYGWRGGCLVCRARRRLLRRGGW